MDPAEKTFIAQLPKHLRKAYEERRRATLGQLKTKYEKERDAVGEPLRKGVENERKHRAVLNTCMFPFTEAGSLSRTGYRFIRASPLAEYGLPNTDFLLFKNSERFKCAVFGECKSSTASAMEVVNQMRDRIRVAEENRERIVSEYLKIEDADSVFFEAVIAAPPTDAHQVQNKVIETGGKIIVWSAETAPQASLSLCEPLRRDYHIRSLDSSELVVRRASMLHRDRELNRSLADTVNSNSTFINTFPKTHRVLELLALVRVAFPGERGLMVTKAKLREYLESDLFYMPTEYIDKLADAIVEDGVTIGALEFQSSENAFRVVASGTSRSSLGQSIEKKWVDHQLDTMRERERQEMLLSLQQELLAQLPRKTTLEAFL